MKPNGTMLHINKLSKSGDPGALICQITQTPKFAKQPAQYLSIIKSMWAVTPLHCNKYHHTMEGNIFHIPHYSEIVLCVLVEW